MGVFHAVTCTEHLCDPTCVAMHVPNLPRNPELDERGDPLMSAEENPPPERGVSAGSGPTEMGGGVQPDQYSRFNQPYYSSNGITLWHGDCRELLPALPAADLVLTDPPYGVTYSSNYTVGQGVKPITNDGTRLSLSLYRTTIPLLKARHVLWFTRWDAWPDVWAELGQWFPIRGLLVWDKGHPGMGDLKHWGPSYELIASAGAGKTIGSRDQSVLKYLAPSPHARLHPTEKPVPLLRYLIGKLNASSVVDPFSGSGSTLAAAHELGVAATGIEISEENCEETAKRLQRLADAPRLPFEDAS